VYNGDENTENLAMIVDGEVVYQASKQPNSQEPECKAPNPEREEQAC
jgi:hypothetical protein